MELRFLWSAARRSWALLLLLAVVGGGLGGASAVLSRHRYRATASLTVTEPSLSAVTGSDDAELPDRYVATQIGIMTANDITTVVAMAIPGATSSSVARAIAVTQRGTSDIVDVTATAVSPRLSAQLANSLSDAYIAQQHQTLLSSLQSAASTLQSEVTSLQRQLAVLPATSPTASSLQTQLAQVSSSLTEVHLTESLAPESSQVFDPAVPPTSPLPRKVAERVAIGALVGLFIALMASTAVAILRPRLRSERDVEDAFGIVVSARIPNRLASSTTTAFDREVMKACLFIETAPAARTPKTVMVVGNRPGVGVTTVAHAMTEVLIRGGHRVEEVDVLDVFTPWSGLAGGVRDPWSAASAASAESVAPAKPTPAEPRGAAATVASSRAVSGRKRPVVAPVQRRAKPEVDPLVAMRHRENGETFGQAASDLVVYDGGVLDTLAPSVGLAQVVDVIVLVVAIPEATSERDANILRAALASATSRLLVVTNEPQTPGSRQLRGDGRQPSPDQ